MGAKPQAAAYVSQPRLELPRAEEGRNRRFLAAARLQEAGEAVQPAHISAAAQVLAIPSLHGALQALAAGDDEPRHPRARRAAAQRRNEDQSAALIDVAAEHVAEHRRHETLVRA